MGVFEFVASGESEEWDSETTGLSDFSECSDDSAEFEVDDSENSEECSEEEVVLVADEKKIESTGCFF